MISLSVQFTPWDKYYTFNSGDFQVKKGDSVIVNTEYGTEFAKVVEIRKLVENKSSDTEEIKSIERVATIEDVDVFNSNNNERAKDDALNYCRKLVKRHNLEMKLVDCVFSFDDKRLIFAFIADGRVDFRNLVRELTKHFQRSVRLHQLGVRDEAKLMGDIGSCGEPLCCATHLKTLGNVTSELAEVQQIAHRGSDRLSGVCSRLKCCLAYESDVYQELSKKFPAMGSKVKTNHGIGRIIGWHVLKGTVDVKIDPEKEGDKPMIVEVPIKK